MPVRKPWDHAIDLIPNFAPRKSKSYPMSPTEQQEVRDFVDDQLKKGYCYNFSYPELLLFHIDSSLRLNRLRLIPYDTLTPSSVSFTALYCGAQSARSPFRLFFT